MRRGRRAGQGAGRSLGLLLVAALGACGTPGAAPSGSASSPGTTQPIPPSTTTAATAAPTTALPGGSLLEAAGPGWSGAGLDGPVPSPGACRARAAADGRPLPDPSCTPGVVDTAVDQADLATTLCRRGGYTASVRPPEALTEPFKERALAAYGDTGPLGAYELDHLVPLELGGSSDTRNLWPEPDDRPAGAANSKDPVENALHALVCAAVTGGPSVPLAVAQRLIASDWTTALAAARAAVVAPR